MNNELVNFGFFSLSLLKGWSVLPPDENEQEMPLTIADPDNGVGALQISTAKFLQGKSPNLSSKDLLQLLDDFSEQRGLTFPFDQVNKSNCKSYVGKSYQSENQLIRIWYASNGKDVLLITYIYDWNLKDKEKTEIEQMVNSIQFFD